MKQVRLNTGTGTPTLLSKDLEKANLTATSDTAYRILSVRLQWLLSDIIDTQEGGLLVGLAHGDYSATEIEECIEASGSINRGDKIVNERAARLVRIVGLFGSVGAAEGDLTLNDGKPIYTKLNWLIPIGKTVDFWWYNQSSGTLVSMELEIVGTAIVKYTNK